ncbi:MAG TPA: hypothetical protein P5240_09720, partial [Syntrophorhabdaceae bacterium]|nr:hypothetical protein [Syntrophorhabdaceae bacterium]
MDKEAIFRTKARLHDYIPIVGRGTIEALYALAERLSGKTVVNVNSTFSGGGVAEILMRMVPLLNQLGVDTRWMVIKGNESFFTVTKKFHNALHGKREDITPEDYALFLEVSNKNMEEMQLTGDILFIHDPQPVVLIKKKGEIGEKWVWRCHIDVSNPDLDVWNFLYQYVVDYDATVFSAPNFARKLPNRQFLIHPS